MHSSFCKDSFGTHNDAISVDTFRGKCQQEHSVALKDDEKVLEKHEREIVERDRWRHLDVMNRTRSTLV